MAERFWVFGVEMINNSLDAFAALARVAQQNLLRSPWAQAQRPRDWLSHLRSEALELEVALARGNRDAITEECGDVLFVAVCLAMSLGAETLSAAMRGVALKMAARKPWLASGEVPRTVEEEVVMYERNKGQ